MAETAADLRDVRPGESLKGAAALTAGSSWRGTSNDPGGAETVSPRQLYRMGIGFRDTTRTDDVARVVSS